MTRSRAFIAETFKPLSVTGLVLGTLFFAASLTPSLVPRIWLTQGALSGVVLACGYGIGVVIDWAWRWLGLPRPSGRTRLIIRVIAGVVCGLIVLVFLWRTAGWQNSIRTLMGLPPIDTAHPVYVGLVALAVFGFLLLLGRLLTIGFSAASKLFEGASRKAAPRRLAGLIGVLLAIVLFWTLANGVLLRAVLDVLDSSFQALDARIDPDTPPPADPMKSGSAASLISWPDLGRQGRAFVASGPSAADIAAFTGKPALEPLRIYVGLNAADTVEQRAQLALDELIRVGGFDRSVLVVMLPTGTGWIDAEAADTVEYLHHGDIASVSMQYSYLGSWLAIVVQNSYGPTTARALFRAVYRHWTAMPHDRRPKLYLYGLSLGSFSAEQAAELFEIIGDPYQGALLVGPPFASRSWRAMTANRNPDSPPWLPRVGDGSFVRFTNQRNALPEAGDHWGPMRIVYLQYASDAITFWEPDSAWREPEWMKEPRGPDVSPEFQWYPIVTFLQLTLDLIMAGETPMGMGHIFAGEHHIEPWIAVTGVTDWSVEDIARLKEKFRVRGEGR